MRVKASTLSVILKDSETVHCYVEVNGESCNLTLRFDRGDTAVLCGYPQDWGVYDTHIDYFNSETPTYEDLEFSGVLDLPDSLLPLVYVSRTIECEILKKLKISVSRQFRSKDWKDSCPKQRQALILSKLNRAIKATI